MNKFELVCKANDKNKNPDLHIAQNEKKFLYIRVKFAKIYCISLCRVLKYIRIRERYISPFY